MKSKHCKGTAFSVQVCDNIRHHIGEIKALESKRKIAFDDRDAAVDEKNECRDHESPEYTKACRMHSEAISQLESLDSAIKFHRGQITLVVEKADDPQLDLTYDPPAEAPKVDPRQKTLEQEAKAKAAQKDKPSAQGLAEQLKASVTNLDFGVQWTKHLMAAGLDTVGKLVEFIEAGGDLEEATDLSGSQAACVAKKVKEWRKHHAKAMAAAEKEVKEDGKGDSDE